MSIALIYLLLLISFLLPLSFIIRVVCAAFYPEISDQMRKHPKTHIVWGLFALAGFIFLAWTYMAALHMWPPEFVVRRTQKQTVLARVQRAGGWAAVRSGCEVLATNYPEGFWWMSARSNAWIYDYRLNGTLTNGLTNSIRGPLPPAVAALQPMEVQVYPARNFGNTTEPNAIVVRVKIYGMPHSGFRSTPYYGLELPFGERADQFKPLSGVGVGIPGDPHSTFREVSKGVFEID